jgi:hypothetical protein
MTYEEWYCEMERRYDRLPTWFWNRAEREARYRAQYGDAQTEKPCDVE